VIPCDRKRLNKRLKLAKKKLAQFLEDCASFKTRPLLIKFGRKTKGKKTRDQGERQCDEDLGI
jgi:hypothetical protein